MVTYLSYVSRSHVGFRAFWFTHQKCIKYKQTESELFLVSLHFAKELEFIKTDFGPELDTQLKELVTKFADVT